MRFIAVVAVFNKNTHYVTKHYSLSPKGLEKTEELEAEIQDYVNKWKPFLEN